MVYFIFFFVGSGCDTSRGLLLLFGPGWIILLAESYQWLWVLKGHWKRTGCAGSLLAV